MTEAGLRFGTHGEIAEVENRPGRVLRHAWDDVEQDFAHEEKEDVDEPCACVVGWTKQERKGSAFARSVTARDSPGVARPTPTR